MPNPGHVVNKSTISKYFLTSVAREQIFLPSDWEKTFFFSSVYFSLEG